MQKQTNKQTQHLHEENLHEVKNSSLSDEQFKFHQCFKEQSQSILDCTPNCSMHSHSLGHMTPNAAVTRRGTLKI